MTVDRDQSHQSLDPSLHAVSYLRVSTKDQATKGGEPEGLSIPAQREAIDHKAISSYNCDIRRHFSDMGESARTADRPGLQELLEYLKNNQVDFVFVHKIDRLARNRFDDIEITLAIQKSGARLVSVTENIDESPSGMLMHGIMSSIAEFYSRNLASEVKKGMRQKVRSGGTPGRAPLGYLNTRTIGPAGGDIRTVISDPERGHLIRMAFELYASGDYSIEALQAELTTQGLTSRPTPKFPAGQFSRAQLCMMLRNKYYMGIVTYEGEEFKGRHEPLVTTELFARVQDVLDMRQRRGSRDRVHKHYLKGLLFCDRCFAAGRTRRLIYSENANWQGNLYTYFKCRGRQERECDLPYLPVDLVEDAVVDFYSQLRLPDDVAAALAEELEECILAEGSTTRELHRNLRARVTGLDQQEERLLDLAMEGSLPQAKIEVDRRDARSKLQQTGSQIEAGVRVLQVGVELLRDPQPVYRQSPPVTRGQFDRSFFSRLFLDDRATVAHGTLNTPFSDVYGQTTVEVPRDTEKAPENLEGLLTDTASLQPDPWVRSWSKPVLVAGAGFEPATSGL